MTEHFCESDFYSVIRLLSYNYSNANQLYFFEHTKRAAWKSGFQKISSASREASAYLLAKSQTSV